MERHEQVSALELFRDGEYKVIMATTVAEEGLDIKECNLVVRYDYAGSPVAMMQARGTSSLLFDIIRHVDMNKNSFIQLMQLKIHKKHFKFNNGSVIFWR